MGAGVNSRIQYSPGVPGPPVAPNSDPLVSIGGGNPFGLQNSLSNARASEIYNDTTVNVTPTNPYAMQIAQAQAGSVIFAEAGDWLLVCEQNAGDEPSYNPANDARGSYARIVTLVGPGAETSNETTFVDVTFDRPILATPVAGDSVRISKPNNVFARVTEQQARDGLIDHSELWYWNTENNSEDVQFWIDSIVNDGVKIEIMRPGEMLSTAVMNNVLSAATESPFNQFGKVIAALTQFDVAGGPIEIPSQELARQNGALPSGAFGPNFRSPMWLRRTIAPGSNPGLAAFVLRITSEQLTNGTPLSDFDKLNCGAVFSFQIDPPAVRTTVSISDRILYAGAGARVVTTLTDGDGQSLQNRSLQISAVNGTITQDPSDLTDENGELLTVLDVNPGSGGFTETISATLSHPAGE